MLWTMRNIDTYVRLCTPYYIYAKISSMKNES